MASSWPLTRRRFFIILFSSITGPAVFWLTTNKGGRSSLSPFVYLLIHIFAHFRNCVFPYLLIASAFNHSLFVTLLSFPLNLFCSNAFAFSNSTTLPLLCYTECRQIKSISCWLNWTISKMQTQPEPTSSAYQVSNRLTSAQQSSPDLKLPA